ncbi:MAG: hypothetical protein JJU40_01325, partial [Rhodobacteraceae bacterium]|nr:hypothetical protein [Paracoccaceae bacterium]
MDEASEMLPPLDPDAADVLARIHAPGQRGYDSMDVAEARAFYAATRVRSLAAPPPVEEVQDIVLKTAHRDIPARVYRPAGADG